MSNFAKAAVMEYQRQLIIREVWPLQGMYTLGKYPSDACCELITYCVKPMYAPS